jgi:hypothetical protein
METFCSFGLLEITLPRVYQQLHGLLVMYCELDVHLQRSFHMEKFLGIVQHLLVKGMREKNYVSPSSSHNLTSKI